jgi:hypothetical protein
MQWWGQTSGLLGRGNLSPWADETDRVSRFICLGAFDGEKVDGRKQRVSVLFLIRSAY